MKTKFKILTPYDLEKNLANYYNREMQALPNDDFWGVFLDGDACFTTPDFGHQIHAIIENNPDYGLFTCLTNRIGTKYQLVEGLFEESKFPEIWKKGKELQTKYYDQMEDITHNTPLSGVFIAINRGVWRKSGGFNDKNGTLLSVDNSIHYAVRDMGGKVGLAKGLMLFHYYRYNTGVKDKSHLL